MKCLVCGTEFEAYRNNHVFCSRSCQQQHRYNIIRGKILDEKIQKEKAFLEQFGISTKKEIAKKEAIEITDWEQVSQAIEKADSRWCESLEHFSTPIRNVVGTRGDKNVTM